MHALDIWPLKTVLWVLFCICLLVGAFIVCKTIVHTDTNNTAISSDNDGQIAGRYHRRSSTARFFSRCRRG